MKNRITFFIVVSLLVFAGLGCRNLFDNSREEHVNPNIEANTPTNDSNTAANNQTNDSESSTGSAAGDTNTATTNSKTISGGVLNGKATNLVKPSYPAAAKAVRASGAVNV